MVDEIVRDPQPIVHDTPRAVSRDEQPSGWTAFWEGLKRGGREVLEGGAQIGARMGEVPQVGATQPEMPGGVARVDQAVRQSGQAYQKNPAVQAHPIIAGAGRIGGNIAATAPLALIPGLGPAASTAGRIVQAAAMGGVSAAMQPVIGKTDFWADKAKQMGVGAAAGAALPSVGAALAPRLPAPQSIGKAFRPLWNFFHGGEEKTVDGFDRTIARQVLEPIGSSIPRKDSGHTLASTVESRLSDAYDRVLPNLSLSRQGAIGAATPETREFVSELDPLEGKQFETFVTNKLLKKFPETGIMSGETFKKVQHDFSSRAMSYLGTQKDALGRALLHTLTDLNETMANENPAWAPELRRVNESWKMWTRMRQAASGPTKYGKFTPDDMLRAIRQQDPTAGHSGFVRADQVLQAYAEAASKAMNGATPWDLMQTFGRHGLVMQLLAGTAQSGGRLMKAGAPAAAVPLGIAAGQLPRAQDTGPNGGRIIARTPAAQ